MNITKLCALGLALSSTMPLSTYSQKLSYHIPQSGGAIYNSKISNNLTNDIVELSALYTNKVSNIRPQNIKGSIIFADKICGTNNVIRLK